ncbi:hypothetical protein F5884DRAFT_194784 [Xylogone sp. PMI_703]|nr:hypothetical protein F5884DRAFT_194784 [Xylogone sp. PMI_703]
MAPRRSSRLRRSNATPKPHQDVSNILPSLVEQEEDIIPTKNVALNSVTSSPAVPRTPATEGRVKPPLDEMHPSKVHQSTTKEPDSGLLLGFVDIPSSNTKQPSGIGQQTPTKTPSSSSFEFRFARSTPKLGPDAQKIMDDLREEALKIKAKLAAEREQERSMGEAGASGDVSGRKIAQPKGKVGRFSDVHMAEFKKMDSIEGHASAYRAQPGKFTPNKNNLKRTQSRAQLDDRVESEFSKPATSVTTPKSDRLENSAPAKRARKNIDDDASTARPVSRSGLETTKNSLNPPSNSFASITTPTKASLARASAAKGSGSLIPTLARSPSKPNLDASSTTLSPIKSGTVGSLRSPSRFNRVKSILKYPGSAQKESSLSASPVPKATAQLNLNKTLPPAPTPTKHVTFPSPSTDNTPAVPTTPSPKKSNIPRPTPRAGAEATKVSPSKDLQYPAVSLIEDTKEVVYPSLEQALANSGLSSQTPEAQQPPPSVPGSFTFRSDKTIKFGPSPRGFGSAPGQASIRQVRPSIAPSSDMRRLPPTPRDNIRPLAAVPHGMSNKKRHRADSDEENEAPEDRSPKKHKASVPEGAMLLAPRLESAKMASKSATPSPVKKKGVLSLSRLNMLARPKMRK